MTSVRLHRRLLKWGNAYGIRVTKAERRRLGAKEHQTLEVAIKTEPTPLDPDDLPVFRLSADAAKRHDEVIGEALGADR